MKVRFSYIGAPTIVFLVLWLGGLITQSGMDWYDRELILSPVTPQGWVFGVAWSIIGFCTALSLIIMWQNLQKNGRLWVVVLLFIMNGLLNIAWTYFFFRRHEIGKAWWVAAALELTTVMLIGLLWRPARLAAFLLLPYAVWVVFALYLNYDVWLINEAL